MPRLAVDPARREIVQVELATKPPRRIIAVAWHRGREQTESALALVEVVQQVYAYLGGE